MTGPLLSHKAISTDWLLRYSILYWFFLTFMIIKAESIRQYPNLVRDYSPILNCIITPWSFKSESRLIRYQNIWSIQQFIWLILIPLKQIKMSSFVLRRCFLCFGFKNNEKASFIDILNSSAESRTSWSSARIIIGKMDDAR